LKGRGILNILFILPRLRVSSTQKVSAVWKYLISGLEDKSFVTTPGFGADVLQNWCGCSCQVHKYVGRAGDGD
jgi:hypothetical protein